MRAFVIITLAFLVFSCGKDDDVKATTEYYKLELEIVSEDGGNVDVFDISTNKKVEKIDSISEGTMVKLIPNANEGYNFSGFWEDDVYIQLETPSFTMYKDRHIKAVFRAEGNTPVEEFGDLNVQGARIVDDNGVPVQLKGMSFFWSQWIGKYWNVDVLNWLTLDWEANIVRASMGVDENGGYIFNRTEKEKVETIVDAAIAKGIYVIIDWHSHHAEDYTQDAADFFSAMAEKYGQYPNVIYEIYNEPLNVSWVGTIKPYAETVISAIREKDPDNLILVGTPNWCQNVKDVIGNTITGTNIAYVLHFYASQQDHYNRLFTEATDALEADIPLFVTEWGVSEASGTGNFNKIWTQEWLDFMDQHKLSWCNWSIADKAETSAALKPGANTNGGWTTEELSESGKYIRDILRQNQGYTNPK